MFFTKKLLAQCCFGLRKVIANSKGSIIISSVPESGVGFLNVFCVDFDVSAGWTAVKPLAVLLLFLFRCARVIRKKSWPCLLGGFYVSCVFSGNTS